MRSLEDAVVQRLFVLGSAFEANAPWGGDELLCFDRDEEDQCVGEYDYGDHGSEGDRLLESNN